MAAPSEYTSGQMYAAELLGTFALVFFGCGAVVGSEFFTGYGIGFLGIAFAFGIAVLVMVYAIGPISGCHINPAITVSMLASGKISGKDAVGYIVAQCIGATVGAGVLLGIVSGMPGYALSLNGLGQDAFGGVHASMTSAFLAEVVLTFLFLIVVHGSTSPSAPKGFAGIAIGLTLFAIHLVGIPIDGTSVNPARSLGPALFVGGNAINQLWLFIIAPIIGGLLAAAVWMWVLRPASKGVSPGTTKPRTGPTAE